jgi:hypothetical protein
MIVAAIDHVVTHLANGSACDSRHAPKRSNRPRTVNKRTWPAFPPQLAEVAVTRHLFAAILNRIARLAMPPPVVVGRMPASNAATERNSPWTEGIVCALPALKP